MIEMTQVAKFMNDDIVPFLRCEEGNPVMEGEVAASGTAPETRPLIANGNFLILEAMEQSEFLHA